MTAWQNRPLDRVYPVVLIDAIVIKVRDAQVANRPVYVAIGVNMDGERDVLGMWGGARDRRARGARAREVRTSRTCRESPSSSRTTRRWGCPASGPCFHGAVLGRLLFVGGTELRPCPRDGIVATMLNDIKSLFARLAGTWSGRGAATYPDVGTFPYLERTAISWEEEWNMLSVLQRTWADDAGQQGRGLHLEAGIVRVLSDGRLEYSCAQDSGRTEVMVGAPTTVGDALVIEWVTTAHSNDERLVRMGRTWQLTGDQLRYRAHLATTRITEYRDHLDAVLVRQASSGG